MTKFHRLLPAILITALILSACMQKNDKKGNAGEPAGDSLDLSSITINPTELGNGSLDSYRLRIQINTEVKKESQVPDRLTEIQAARTNNPFAEQLSFSMSGRNKIGFIRIGDQAWMQSGDLWIEAESERLPFLDENIHNIGAATAGLAGSAEFVGTENVNSIDTHHYTSDDPPSNWTLDIYDRIQRDVWIAIEGDYVVKYIWTAESEEVIERWSWEIYDINAPITIEPPTDFQDAREDIN